MTWAPEYQVFDTVGIANNLLTFFENNQDDALVWASGSSELQGFRKFYNNASGRVQQVFPSMLILAQRCTTDLAGDILQGDFQLIFEGAVSGSHTDDLVTNTKYYSQAVESMLSNIGPTDFAAETNVTSFALYELETEHDVLRPITSGFLQIFQTRVMYKIQTAAFSGGN